MHRGGVRRYYPGEDAGDNREQAGRDGGQRGRGRGHGRGRGQGRGKHPSGLSGRDIGLWYASRGRAKKKEREARERHVVHINQHDERQIRNILGNASDTSEDVDEEADGDSFQDEEICFDQSVATHVLNKSSEREPLCSGTSVLFDSPDLNEWLQRDLSEKRKHNEKFKDMLEFRKNLPSYKMKEVLLEAMKENQVVVISGETGCGKTTQVAQFILDDAIEQGFGSQCHIICTQPRRISAISVAERVAAERGEYCGDGSVGFQIRLENKLPRKRGSILYCTTGILLRLLISDPLLTNISHIVLDEIHERDLLSDFLLIIVKDLIPLRSDLKLILMSATLNSDLFSEFFYSCPKLNIPGFTYPVKEYYLEDIYEILRYSREGSARDRNSSIKPWQRRRMKDELNKRMEKEEENRNLVKHLQQNPNGMKYSSLTIQSLCEADLDVIDFQLIVCLVRHICSNMEDGAILIFLPGWDDISTLHDMLQANPVFRSSGYIIIPLHSLMPTKSQQQVFERPPPGVRKIVIATNIAETSITIDDIVYVIDSGKIKEKTYDTAMNMSCLQTAWTSKASSKQRKGRAGRVQAGYCFHLFTRLKEESLAEYQVPEILRTPLEELCLQIKILKLGKIEQFLEKALQAPSSYSLKNAIRLLTELNALDANENLTPLGYHLAALPINPKVGKMILFGAIFSCLDPVLTIASSLGFKDPFFIPMGKEKEADAVRRDFAKGSQSDHIMLINVFHEWEKVRRSSAEKNWCWRKFLSMRTLAMIDDMKCQFARHLHEIGFIDKPYPNCRQSNIHSGNIKLIKAVICAGLYPNVAKVTNPLNVKRFPKFSTKEHRRVQLHPKSVNAGTKYFDSHWIIFHEMMKTSGVIYRIQMCCKLLCF